MKVYILYGDVPYEGDEVLGVYLSDEDAQSARDKYIKRTKCQKLTGFQFQSYSIAEYEVGKPAKTSWE